MLRRLAWTMLAFPPLLSIAAARADDVSNPVRVEPQEIRIGVFYSGRRVRVTAAVADAEEVVIRVTGPKEPLTLKRKGKKYGFLWMNVGEVHYDAVPTLYLLRSSRKLDELAAPETRRRLEIGFDALRDRIPAGSKGGARDLFGELVKLKERDRLFSSETAEVSWRPLADGRREASGDVFLPAKTPVGDYTVDVFGFQNGVGQRIGAARIHLERASVVSFIEELAANHGLLYGCLAVAVAVLAGLATGILFGMGKRESH